MHDLYLYQQILFLYFYHFFLFKMDHLLKRRNCMWPLEMLISVNVPNWQPILFNRLLTVNKIRLFEIRTELY